MGKVLITGAAGFLGKDLVKVFAEAGHAVLATDVSAESLAPLTALGAETGVVDVTDEAAIRGALEGVDVVVHAAGIFDLTADPALMWRVNADGAERTCTLAAEAGVSRFILISSTSIYGFAQSPIPEDHPKNPFHEYAKSKWAGEQRCTAICEQADLPLGVLRPTLIYGPGSRYGLAPWLSFFAMRAWRGRTVFGMKGGPMTHMVHVRDVSRAALHLAENREVRGAFNVADETPLPASDLINAMCDALGANLREFGLPWWILKVLRPIKPFLVWVMRGPNAKFARAWARLADEEQLERALCPRFDLDWMDFLSRDNVFDNAALKTTGFTYSVPDPRPAMDGAIAWYREHRWLPTPQAEAADTDRDAPDPQVA